MKPLKRNDRKSETIEKKNKQTNTTETLVRREQKRPPLGKTGFHFELSNILGLPDKFLKTRKFFKGS